MHTSPSTSPPFPSLPFLLPIQSPFSLPSSPSLEKKTGVRAREQEDDKEDNPQEIDKQEFPSMHVQEKGGSGGGHEGGWGEEEGHVREAHEIAEGMGQDAGEEGAGAEEEEGWRERWEMRENGGGEDARRRRKDDETGADIPLPFFPSLFPASFFSYLLASRRCWCRRPATSLRTGPAWAV
jgi:hypothetical protein